MGTRGLLIFIYKGRKIGIYNHYDSYPSGLGTDFLKFVKMLLRNGKLETFLEKLFNIPESDHCDQSSDAMFMMYNILNGISPVYLCNAMEFLEDSLFCEWAYGLDFDHNSFEIYECGSIVVKYDLYDLPEDLSS